MSVLQYLVSAVHGCDSATAGLCRPAVVSTLPLHHGVSESHILPLSHHFWWGPC